ncbi:hypothetical protein BDW67DRAFT_149915 [Aspergillus spinulosporus]
MEEPKPLEAFSRLNSQVSLYTSPVQDPDQPPALVIICSWLFAAPKHIAKYAQIYKTKLPKANILLIQPVVGDMVWTSDYAQLQQLSPAVAAIDAFLDSRSNQSYHLVVHAFSNAGSHAAVQLAEAYTAVHPSASLPVTGLILDSCPGAPSAILSANAMILALPKSPLIRLLGAALIYSVVVTVALLDFLRLYQNVISKTRHVLNSQSGCFLRRGVRRAYLYSRTDAMVPWIDILDHAREARRLAESGDDLVQTVEFTGSGHVEHLTVAEEEYTKAVLSVAASRG